MFLLLLLATPAADLSGGYTRPTTPEKVGVVQATDEYTRALARVRAGDAVVLVVGLNTSGIAEGPVFHTPALLDFEPGVYDCWNESGVPKMQRRPTAAPVLLVPPLLSFGPTAPLRCAGPNCR